MPYSDMNIDLFCEKTASSSPAPGGGGVSALCGALAASLCSMVCALTQDKAKFAAFEENTRMCAKKAEALRLRLLGLIDGDAEAFLPLSRAYSLPKNEPGRAETMECALMTAAAAPMEMLRLCAEIAGICAGLKGKSSTLAASDIGCAAALAGAAMKSAAINVRVNTRLMNDRKAAAALDSEAEALLREYLQLTEDVYESIWSTLA